MAMAWTGMAAGQTSAQNANEVEQATPGAMQQRDYAGEQAKVKE